jgi:hypothetical protein
MDLADLDNNSVAPAEPILQEAKVKDNATGPKDEVRCVIPGFDRNTATDPMEWMPFVTGAGVFYPKVGDRAVIGFPEEGPPTILHFWPKASSPDVAF